MEEGDHSYVVSVEEDSKLVDWSWVKESLGSKKFSCTTNSNPLPDTINTEDEAIKEVGEDSSLIKSFSGKNLKLKETKGQTKELKACLRNGARRCRSFIKRAL